MWINIHILFIIFSLLQATVLICGVFCFPFYFYSLMHEIFQGLLDVVYHSIKLLNSIENFLPALLIASRERNTNFSLFSENRSTDFHELVHLLIQTDKAVTSCIALLSTASIFGFQTEFASFNHSGNFHLVFGFNTAKVFLIRFDKSFNMIFGSISKL